VKGGVSPFSSTGWSAALPWRRAGKDPGRGTESCFVGAAEICSFPEPRTFARTVCLVRHLDTIPREHEQFLDGVMERVGAAGGHPLVLGYVRLNMVARLPDASR
jgi:hypothetical protein